MRNLSILELAKLSPSYCAPPHPPGHAHLCLGEEGPLDQVGQPDVHRVGHQDQEDALPGVATPRLPFTLLPVGEIFLRKGL